METSPLLWHFLNSSLLSPRYTVLYPPPCLHITVQCRKRFNKNVTWYFFGTWVYVAYNIWTLVHAGPDASGADSFTKMSLRAAFHQFEPLHFHLFVCMMFGIDVSCKHVHCTQSEVMRGWQESWWWRGRDEVDEAEIFERAEDTGLPCWHSVKNYIESSSNEVFSCKIQITVESLMSETVELGAEKVEMNNSRKQLFEKGSRSN